jgi:hypothetical protein
LAGREERERGAPLMIPPLGILRGLPLHDYVISVRRNGGLTSGLMTRFRIGFAVAHGGAGQ